MIKFGIIGTNFISDWFVSAARTSGVAEPYALYSRKEETGRAFAEKNGMDISRVYTSLDDIADSGIDAMYIASPNYLHCEQSLFFLERGIPVLCEKPGAASAEDYRRMIAASETHGALLLEAMRHIHDPAWHEIKKHVSEIGKLRGAAFEYCQYSSRYKRHLAGEAVNAFNPSLCNAAIMDIGVYPITALVDLLGVPDDVYCSSHFFDNGFEASGTVTMKYCDFDATATYSKIYDSPRPSAIFGEDGTILFDRVSTPTHAELRLRGGEVREIALPQCELNLVYEIRDFASLLSEGKTKHRYNTLTEDTIAVIDRARKCSGIKF